MEVEQLLTKLSKAVSYAYRKDGTCPAVLTSTLKDGDIYVSIVRYGKQFDHGKEVVCKSTKSDLKSALSDVAKQFVEIIKLDKNPVEQLKDHLESKILEDRNFNVAVGYTKPLGKNDV